ncbi:2-oxo acid dehydrogenase subunit E2 [Thauera linaloolentis]|uniref:Dihydrolipoyllysine-residue acetyltransferase component of pyruvate dehydrogenase complex n=1 Tax=Thauera linaloolentis (strain DSM 12138 / JCM 21573 / CCUG 41526 / CIP 105981 / IAM 15112 / NBRC 102519 / 47Lol) TaxID=1123367 RepID=N6Y6S1_THAL4|nr:2-oxo acid dehydrogenase subunit E2 [Thauera linaloolentis]ENO87275.1 dihydrolipoyllysine-residue succinyltransferase [Thauera linaloolentis 47Lol = DSM 12138]MCM8566725.1 2-oxo acid dehydrogenase subunit E2 [Thauera linaloolentis]
MSARPDTEAPAWPASLPPMPVVDFSLFGEVDTVPLPRHQKLVASFLARNWAQIPHVTHHDEADVAALETVRREAGEALGVKLTPVPFIIKAVVKALQAFPRFNASLGADGNSLVMKRYFHIGVAVETPNGLVVPVIRDCDRKSIGEIAAELADKAGRARAKGLPITEMSGGCFSVSSLGNLGGTGFTPIINAPEVAILGVTRATERLRLVDGEVRSVPVLPLSLSYDHRVINGADAARFTRFVADALADPAALA